MGSCFPCPNGNRKTGIIAQRTFEHNFVLRAKGHGSFAEAVHLRKGSRLRKLDFHKSSGDKSSKFKSQGSSQTLFRRRMLVEALGKFRGGASGCKSAKVDPVAYVPISVRSDGWLTGHVSYSLNS